MLYELNNVTSYEDKIFWHLWLLQIRNYKLDWAKSRRGWRKVCKRDSALSLASLPSLEGNLRAALHCNIVSFARLSGRDAKYSDVKHVKLSQGILKFSPNDKLHRVPDI